MKYTFVLLIGLFVLPLTATSQIYNKEIAAAIDLRVEDNSIIKITGSAHNKTPINKSLRFTLSVIRSGTNKSTNKQEGRFVLGPGEKQNLALTSINVNETDRTIILLLVYQDDTIVGKDRKVLNGINGEADEVRDLGKSSEDSDMKTTREDGFILRGVVIEDTKTKAGNDFYDMFYSSYLNNNINGDKIVKIEERLAIGNTTQMNILVGDETVVQFFVNPRTQYLRQMADQSIYRVIAHFQRLKDTKDQITRY